MSTYKKHTIRDLERQKIVLQDKLEFTNDESQRTNIESILRFFRKYISVSRLKVSHSTF